jgi:hypothetical protein
LTQQYPRPGQGYPPPDLKPLVVVQPNQAVFRQQITNSVLFAVLWLVGGTVVFCIAGAIEVYLNGVDERAYAIGTLVAGLSGLFWFASIAMTIICFRRAVKARRMR